MVVLGLRNQEDPFLVPVSPGPVLELEVLPAITVAGVTGEGVSALIGQAWVCEDPHLVRGRGGGSPKSNGGE